MQYQSLLHIIFDRLLLLLPDCVPMTRLCSFLGNQPLLWKTTYLKIFLLPWSLLFWYMCIVYVCIYLTAFFTFRSAPFKLIPSLQVGLSNIWSQSLSQPSYALSIPSYVDASDHPWSYPPRAVVLMKKVCLLKWLNQTSYHTLCQLSLLLFPFSPISLYFLKNICFKLVLGLSFSMESLVAAMQTLRLHMRSSSLTGWTQPTYIGNMESSPLDNQGSPSPLHFRSCTWYPHNDLINVGENKRRNIYGP